MQTLGDPDGASRLPSRQIAVSVAAHVLVIGLMGIGLHHRVAFVAPYRLPGSEHGHNFLLAYLPDRAAAESAAARAKPDVKVVEAKTPLPTPRLAKTPQVETPSTSTMPSPNPTSTSGADALGSGNITIALTAYFPPPHPDLSALPHGTRGDVIVRVVIDADGKISQMKMTSGLGYGVDETVLATVQQWTFHPALQNGRPVASEQELHFHYERG